MGLPAEAVISESILRRGGTPIELTDRLAAAGISQFATDSLPPLRPGLLPIVADLEAAEKAAGAGFNRLGLRATASEQFAETHLDGSVDELMHRIRRVLLDGPLEVDYRVYVDTATHCPYEGEQEVDWVAHLVETLVEWGAGEVFLVETVGRATPFEVERLLFEVQESVGSTRLGLRFSDAFGMALANTMSALNAGIDRFETVGGGIDATCATEDLVHLLDGLEVVSGIDALAVAEAMSGFCESKGVDYKSRAGAGLLAAEVGK